MAAVMTACFASVAFAADDVEDLVARYTFDGDAADDGLTENGAQLTYADGKVTLGDGSNTSYLVSDIDFSGMEEITIGMRLSLPQDSGGGQWVYDITSQESHDGNPAYGFAMYYENDTLHAQIYSGCSSPVPPSAEVTMYIGYLESDEIVPVVVTYSADGVLTLYVDDDRMSVEVDDAAFADIIGEAPAFQIGRCSWGSGFYGRSIEIDEIAVYDRALTEDEVIDAFDMELVDYETEGTDETDAPETDAVTTAAQETETEAVTSGTASTGDSANAAVTDAAEENGGCGSSLTVSAVIFAAAAVVGTSAVKRRR